MMVRTQEGVVVIVGDTHSGIINVIKKAKRLTREKMSMVVGGFSLGSASPEDLASVVKSFRRLGVEKVAPCHSSGDRTRDLFQKEYGEDYIECGVGRVIVC
jgi:7,8-dihydropterin-6-yl-methyl-4-(beta-D-ribofuranosyl)aminobenzene 5'-phosphate synthase